MTASGNPLAADADADNRLNESSEISERVAGTCFVQWLFLRSALRFWRGTIQFLDVLPDWPFAACPE